MDTLNDGQQTNTNSWTVTLFEKTYSQHEGIIANIAKLLVL